LTLVHGAETSDDDDLVADQRGGMDVGRREYVARIAVDIDSAIEMQHHDVAINAEILVVVVFVFAADEDDAPVRRRGGAFAERPEASARPGLQGAGAIESLIGPKGGNLASDQPFKERIVHPLRIGGSETRGTPLAEDFRSDARVERNFARMRFTQFGKQF
jgi:hypothetical protein